MAVASDVPVAYRVVASDLDGTLLLPNGELSERTKTAIQQVMLSGVSVVIATARPLRDAIRIAQSLSVSGPIICQNGALIALTPDFKNFLRRDLLSSSQIRSIIDFILRTDPYAQIAIDYPHFRLLGCDWPGPFNAGANQPMLWPLTSSDIPGRRAAACIMIRNSSIDGQILAAELNVAVTTSEYSLIEISAQGATKAKALKKVCEYLQVEAENVISFGDMPNDTSMLQYAGLGVAVGNAAPQVQQAADLVAPPNHEDGVAAVLENLLGIEPENRGELIIPILDLEADHNGRHNGASVHPRPGGIAR